MRFGHLGFKTKQHRDKQTQKKTDDNGDRTGFIVHVQTDRQTSVHIVTAEDVIPSLEQVDYKGSRRQAAACRHTMCTSLQLCDALFERCPSRISCPRVVVFLELC